MRLINTENVDNYDDDAQRYYIREGIIIVPKNAVIPNGMVV